MKSTNPQIRTYTQAIDLLECVYVDPIRKYAADTHLGSQMHVLQDSLKICESKMLKKILEKNLFSFRC